VALRSDSAAVGVCTCSPRGWTWVAEAAWRVVWQPGSPPFGLNCPLPPSAPLNAAAGQHDGHAQWQLDGEGDVVGGACEGSLEGP
jgi:hypothetical protein